MLVLHSHDFISWSLIHYNHHIPWRIGHLKLVMTSSSGSREGKLFIFFTRENEWGKIRNLHLVIFSSLKRTNQIFDVLPAFVIYGGVLSHGIWWLCVCACIRMSFSFQNVIDGRCELGRLLYLYELQIFASLKWEQ